MDMTKNPNKTLNFNPLDYKFEIAFLIAVIIVSSIAKFVFNFILDYKIIIIIVGILWYFGYLERFRIKFKQYYP